MPAEGENKMDQEDDLEDKSAVDLIKDDFFNGHTEELKDLEEDGRQAKESLPNFGGCFFPHSLWLIFCHLISINFVQSNIECSNLIFSNLVRFKLSCNDISISYT